MADFVLNLIIKKGTTFGPVEILCKDSEGAAFPLAGWSALAQVRKTAASAVVHNLGPVIAADDSAGLVTLPEIAWAVTETLPLGDYQWDLILVSPTGKRLPPFLGGAVPISRPITHTAT